MQLVDKILALQRVLHISVYMCVTFRKAFQIQNDSVQGLIILLTYLLHGAESFLRS